MEKSGFTLIELIITIAIMGLILIIAIPSITALQNNNKDKGYEYYADSLIEASKVYVSKEGVDITPLGIKEFTGCVDITFNDLLDADLIKLYDDSNIDCSNAKVRYTKEINKESYEYNLTCINKKTNEVVFSKQNIKNETCSVVAN